MSLSISEEAIVLCGGFKLIYFDKADVAKWADRWIVALEAPDDPLFDLSLNGRMYPDEIVSHLRNMASSEESLPVHDEMGFLGLMYAQKKLAAQHAIAQLFYLVDEPGLTSEERSQIYYLDHGIDLAANQASGTLSQIKSQLHKFLSPHAEQLMAKYPALVPMIQFDS